MLTGALPCLLRQAQGGGGAKEVLMSDHSKEGADSGSKLSTGPSDASSNSEDLSKSAPRSRRPQFKKQRKVPGAQTIAPLFEVDDSTNTVSITKGARIFGTDPYSIQTLLEQVRNVTPRNGKYDLQNLKWSVTTVQGIAPRNELEGLLAVQMIGAHTLAMECLRRASLQEQTPEGIDSNVNVRGSTRLTGAPADRINTPM